MVLALILFYDPNDVARLYPLLFALASRERTGRLSNPVVALGGVGRLSVVLLFRRDCSKKDGPLP